MNGNTWLIVIQKDGNDGGWYPLLDEMTGPWTIGQNEDCDIRVRVSYLLCLFTSSIYNILSFLE